MDSDPDNLWLQLLILVLLTALNAFFCRSGDGSGIG